MNKLRVTFGEGTTSGRAEGSRKTRDLDADVTVITVGGFLVFRDRHQVIVLMTPEVCTYMVERVTVEER